MTQFLPGQAEAIAEVNALRERITVADIDTMSLILGQAHTHNAWTDKQVSNELLKKAYDLAKMGPTGMNMQPMRLVFLRGEEKENRLVPHMLDSNREKTSAAPLTAILANDLDFYKNMDRVFPIFPDAASMFSSNPEMARENAERNGTLQAAYFMMALRSVGLDVAPMSGFDPKGVNEEFFGGTNSTVNFIINIGHGDSVGVYPRLPRLDFEAVSEFK
ncbi:malonic semialdehyde reductase [Amphritea japonica]|uniref:3-hydroxypropanoate dehydrogenase n=1 Tax=Amphritea japonica ATCC BAA-1530 TaxID=1278309 RepID=A0A7R6ST76_9GAMM|nr:malonic semialdehyde reductase [Amphritea japonica]BBB27119.1 3-hydroxypropanoate dehydrogenase [Amphritea japonica ATCC BAA-1530]